MEKWIPKIGIVGFGYIGKALWQFFKNHAQVIAYDPMYQDLQDKSKVNNCDIVFICVPTNAKVDGGCDLFFVEETVNWVTCPLIVIKSTVPPQTTERLKLKTRKNICFSPEFVGESKYGSGVYNFGENLAAQPHFIFGGDRKDTQKLVELYQLVAGPERVYRQTDSTTAEMVKYMDNSFFATKLTFFYEFSEICKAHREDYHTVRELFLLDPRMGKHHTAVFKENKAPFSGKCLPKDTAALIVSSKEKGYTPQLLEETMRSCKRISDLRSHQC